MSDLVKIDAKEYGLEENKAKQVSDMFKPMLDKMVELKEEHNEIIKLDASNETCAKARELRLRIVKVRTGTAKIHKELKLFYVNGGRFVDGWKNAQIMASQGLEGNLQNIEDHFINIQKEKMEKLQEFRIKELGKYDIENIPGALGAMDADVFNNYLAGVKANYQIRVEAEEKAEADRIETERKQVLELQRRNKTSRLIDFIDDYDNIVFADLTDEDYEKLCEDAIAKRTVHEEEQEAIRKENEKLKQEAVEREKEDKKERLRLEGIAQKEAAERAKVEAELQAQRDAEAKRIQAEKEAQEADLGKGDKEKYEDFKNELISICTKYGFKSKEYQMLYKKCIAAINCMLQAGR